MNLIELLILIIGICYSLKVYFHLRVKNEYKKATIAKMLFQVYGISIFFPILRKTSNPKELRNIKWANTFMYLCYFFIIVTAITILTQLRNGSV